MLLFEVRKEKQMNTNIFIAMAVVAGVFAIIMYVMPFLRKKGFDYYNEVKLALMIFGYAFRDDKVKEIANMAFEEKEPVVFAWLDWVLKEQLEEIQSLQDIISRFSISADKGQFDEWVKGQ